MFKKLPLSLCFAMFGLASFGQTIVSTSPQNKNVVLEEFTGIHCVYCPQGHAIAKAIQDANPEDVSLINIHVGSFAVPSGGQPDFRTPYGTAIVNQTGLTGYPGGTVNRHVFPGRGMTPGGTAMGRGSWTVSSNETLVASSNVNVAVEATIDIVTKVLTVHVEAYYTGNSPQGSNLLNVALLQNNTLGPQTGGGQGNEYNHMHRLVEMITGQWGEVINTTTAGTFIDRTFTYTIPEAYNNVPAEIADMEVVAFITNTQQETPSGSRTIPEFSGLSHANDASLSYIVELPETTCVQTITPEVNIENLGQNPITSLAIEYTINGDSHVYNWTGNITSLRNETIELPEVEYDLQANNTLVVTIPNDDNNANNTATTSFEQAMGSTRLVEMTLTLDIFGNQTYWFFRDGTGSIIYSGGGYPANNPQTITETFEFDAGCYSFEIRDLGNNGGGPVSVIDNQGNEIFVSTGNYGAGETVPFSSNGLLGTNNVNLDNISLYPNPARTVLNIKNAENANIQIYDVLGKLIHSGNNISMDEQVNVEKFQTGTYFMKISIDNMVTTKRFVISK